MRATRMMLLWLLPSLALAANAAPSADVIDLASFPADSVWRCANSRVSSAKDADGKTIWRWEIGSGEAFLWLNEQLPLHSDLPRYQRFVYDLKFTGGQIDLLWPRTVGLLPAPYEKLACEWNLFYFTHPHETWLTYQQVLNDPTWNSTAMSSVPAEIKLDRSRMLGFVAMAKSERCVIELRNCRLVRDRVRVEKSYLTHPIGWPVGRSTEAGFEYRTPYVVTNVSDAEVKVAPSIHSGLKWFELAVNPAESEIAPGESKTFEVVAKLRDRSAAALTEETAVVDFVADGDVSTAYRTETFCTVPLSAPARRMIVCSSDEVKALRAKPQAAVNDDARFWTSVSLADQTEIPAGFGHMIVYGIPYDCPRCKSAKMKVAPTWLTTVCPACGFSEHHTRAADATWAATWAQIHPNGPSPLALGCAYLRTGDEQYARKVIELLKLLAQHYEYLPWHNGGHPLGWDHEEPSSPAAFANGASCRWANTPSYGTNFIVQGLAMLHNMVVDSPSWTDSDRELVYRGLWVPVVTELIKITPGISNMNDIINRDLILIGLSTGDANMIYRGTTYPTGLASRLRDISGDGFSDEGSALNYHLAAMHEWLRSIELIANSRIAMPELTDRALAALKMPLERASLAGVAYCTGNSGGAYFAVPLDHPMFLLADAIFPAEQWPRARSYSITPVLFKDAGWMILRSGNTAREQVQVDFDFGRSHGHGDLDRMNVGLVAFGVPLAADPGSSYNYNTNAASGPAADAMDSAFVANTIVVDGKQQLRGAGKLVEWKPDGAEQRVVAEISEIYPGVTWQRSVSLKDGVVTVIDDVRSDAEHRYESAWHFFGSAQPIDGCSIGATIEADRGLLKPRALNGAPAMEWTYRNAKVRVREQLEERQVAYTAQTGACWDNVRGLAVDGLFIRRQCKATRFVTTIEPRRDDVTK